MNLSRIESGAWGVGEFRGIVHSLYSQRSVCEIRWDDTDKNEQERESINSFHSYNTSPFAYVVLKIDIKNWLCLICS